MRLLFEGGYYSMCGYYSNKYMSLVTRYTCTDQQNTDAASKPRKAPAVSVLIGMRMAACPFCARDKLLRSRRHEYAIFSHLQPNKRRVYKHGASMLYLRADSCISFVANGDSVTKLFTRKKAFLLDNIKDRSSIPRMHGQ